ncbi:MAG: ATP-binding cassette domain-containing protein [Firmicutes bacterium]|nr:ATP-binding cassette domain-containing protein [Bacillota bacterium]
MSTPLIETRGLKKYFKTSHGFLHAVDDINITIESGKTLGVVGESGCGKSTLGRTVLRLIEPTEGEILYDGENIVGYDKKQMKLMRRNMQLVFQDPYASLDPRKSVIETIAEPLIINSDGLSKADAYDKARKIMDTVGLAERLTYSYPHELDGGRRQRIGVARALALNPRFIVCDEPVSALDVSIQAQILNLFMDLQDDLGLTYMFITHDLSVVRHISDEIMVMYMGQCVEKSPSKELFTDPHHPYTKALLGAILEPDVSSRQSVKRVLHGEVSSPINPKPGCRFASRCQFATEACTAGAIPVTDLGGGHTVACVLENR